MWQRRARRSLTAEDERQIRENLTGFFRLLDTWDRRDGVPGSEGTLHRQRCEVSDG